MQALLVDPAERTVTPVQLKDGGGNLDEIYRLLGCSNISAAHINDRGDLVYVDDEGLLKGPTDFFLLDPYPQPLAGKGLIVGTDAEGNDVAPSVTRDWVVENIDFGAPMRIGSMIMFMGDRTRREIRA